MFRSIFSDEIGPFQKTTNPKEYNRVVDGLMLTQGITREEAEKEYNAYLQNPNDYALNKVSRFWLSPLVYRNISFLSKVNISLLIKIEFR